MRSLFAFAMPLLTIVFTDVVESSATKRDTALGRDSHERDQAYLNKIQARHFTLVRECCQAHKGSEVSTIGDAFYLTFEDPVEAVRCAAEIQRRLTASRIETPRGPLRLRIGVHSGFPEPFEGGWHGTDVDTAARIEGTASPQQVLLSSRTYELVRHMSDVKFHFCGEFALKGVGNTEIWEADWDGNGPRRTAVPPVSSAQRKKKLRIAGPAVALILIVAWAGYRLERPNRIANDLKTQFHNARDAAEAHNSVAATRFIAVCENDVSQLLEMDPTSGYALYYRGEISRLKGAMQIPPLFTPEYRCPDFHEPPVDLSRYETDFVEYLAYSNGKNGVDDSQSNSADACYDRSSGYCWQRTRWVEHLLANDLYLQALQTKNPDLLARANSYAEDALRYHDPQSDTEGFVQCTPTSTLLGQIRSERERLIATSR